MPEENLKTKGTEVEEETGVGNATIKGLITKTYHIYDKYGGWHLKQTSWFPMAVADSTAVGNPQQEEGITAVEWVSPNEWHRRLEGSYGTLRTLSETFKAIK